MDYLNADTIFFQNIVPSNCSIKKAFLISERLNNFVVGSTPLPDIPLALTYNNNAIVFDSTCISTNIHYCSTSNPAAELFIVVKDVTALTLPNNNILEVPCQGCNVKTGQAVYIGFNLVILYENQSMPTTNVAVFLNDQSFYSLGMGYTFTGLNPVNTANDVGLAFQVENIGDSTKFTFNGNYLGALYPTQSMIDNNDFTTQSGSFVYESNTLFQVADDTPNATIDSSDALANVKTYLANNAVNCNLLVDLKPNPGCINVLQSFIFAYSTPCPARSIQSAQTYSLCNGQSIQLSASAGATAYSWYPGTGLSDSTVANPVASPTPGTYNYIVQVDSAGCKHTEHITLSVYPSPTSFSVGVVTPPICPDSIGAISITSPQGGKSPYSYSIGGSPQTGNTFTNILTGTYIATVFDSRGCPYSQPFVLNQVNNADANFNMPDSACTDAKVEPKNTSGTINNYAWYVNGVLVSSSQYPVFNFDSAGAYDISLAGYHDLPACSDTVMKVLYVKECPPDSISITTPNIFTPNADGINDIWLPSVYSVGFVIDDIQMTIYDRWGIKVFGSADVKKGWDGRTTSGMECNEGTYFFVVKYSAHSVGGENKSGSEKGYIQLSR